MCCLFVCTDKQSLVLRSLRGPGPTTAVIQRCAVLSSVSATTSLPGTTVSCRSPGLAPQIAAKSGDAPVAIQGAVQQHRAEHTSRDESNEQVGSTVPGPGLVTGGLLRRCLFSRCPRLEYTLRGAQGFVSQCSRSAERRMHLVLRVRRRHADAPPPARLTPWTQGLTCAPGDCGPDAADARDAKTCEASGGVMPTARRHWRRRGASWPAAEQRMPGVAPAGHRTPSQTFSFSPSPYGPSTADDTLPNSICGSYSRVSVRVASASLPVRVLP